MLGRHIRLAGLKLIEAKVAADTIAAPSLSSLKGQKTKELGGVNLPDIKIPKVVSLPGT